MWEICIIESGNNFQKHEGGNLQMTSSNTCFVVVNGYYGDDGYIDGTIRIFSTRQKAEEFIKKLQEEMQKGKRPGEQFSDYYNQTIVEIEIE